MTEAESQGFSSLPRSARIAVIGAGPSGLPALKALLDQGFTNVTGFDRGKRVGGNWVFDAESGHSSVFETTHIISSKDFSQYIDHPMPAHYADYPGHRELAAYFQSYAERFELLPKIRFQTEVLRVEPRGERGLEGWTVTSRDARSGEHRSEAFDFVVVANGHHWKPRYPDYPGRFTGEWTHSHFFKRAEPYRGKRVLVIGGGNSACDCAVETSRISEYTDLSLRRGYWFLPKFVFGLPSDHIHVFIDRWLRFLPKTLRVLGSELLLRLWNGPHSAYGLPEPDHHLYQTHPTMNSELLYFLRHGKIGVKKDIERLDGKVVHFKDGTSREYDAVICCTGFWISHPFLDSSIADFSQGRVPLYLRMLPARLSRIAFIGLFQPIGCIWPGAELQSKLLARMLVGQWSPPKDLDAAILAEEKHWGVRQLVSPRHTITVDDPVFRRRLLRELH